MDTLNNADLARNIMEKSENAVPSKVEPVINNAINNLQLYFCKDYVVETPGSKKIIIRQPRISDFIKYGDKVVYEAVMPFTTNPTSIRVKLWDMNIDWTKITDFQLFSLLIRNSDNEYTPNMFGAIKFSDLRTVQVGENSEDFILCDEKQDLIIDKEAYLKISKCIQTMFCITLKTEIVKGRYNKEDVYARNDLKCLIKKTMEI